ncbi:MAG: hypothetical protein ACK4TA_21560, partial [Saprospiraceae bacterium]
RTSGDIFLSLNFITSLCRTSDPFGVALPNHIVIPSGKEPKTLGISPEGIPLEQLLRWICQAAATTYIIIKL